MYNLYGKTEFPFFHHIETELKIFRNGKGNFWKRKISTPRYVWKIVWISFYFFRYLNFFSNKAVLKKSNNFPSKAGLDTNGAAQVSVDTKFGAGPPETLGRWPGWPPQNLLGDINPSTWIHSTCSHQNMDCFWATKRSICSPGNLLATQEND